LCFLIGLDENIHPSKMVDILGDKALADKVAQSAIELYTKASEYAAKKGIIIADTKFEFGLDENNQLVLVDEVLTPGIIIKGNVYTQLTYITQQIHLVSGQLINIKQVIHKTVLTSNFCVTILNLFNLTRRQVLSSLKMLSKIP
jgi:hypothetical protein